MPYNPNVDLVVGIFLIMAPLLIVGWLVLAVILIGKPGRRNTPSLPDQNSVPNQPVVSASSTRLLLDTLDRIERDLNQWSSNGDPETTRVANDMLQSCLSARSRLKQIQSGKPPELTEDPTGVFH